MRGCRRLGGVGAHCVEGHVGDLAMWGRTVWKDKSETWRCGDALCGKTSRRLGGVGTHCVERQVGAVWKDKSETWRCAKHIVRSSSESWGALCDRL